MTESVERFKKNPYPALAFAVSVRLLMSLYWLIRFSGHIAEGDSARTTSTILSVLETGQLIPVEHQIYPYGFLYPVYVAVTSLFTGLHVQDIQALVLPLLGLLLTVVAFNFYWRILQNPTAAAVAVTLLNLQGDFLYTSHRGSHEKLDFLLIFVSLLVIMLSVAWFDSLKERIALAFTYYLAILAENTSNVFFASTFTFTLLLAFIFWLVLSRINRQKASGSSWLIYIALMSLVFTFLVIFVWYPPAENVLLTARDLTERLVIFLFSSIEPPAGIFLTVSSTWVFPGAWIILRLFDILIVLAAAIGWFFLVRRIFQRNKALDSPEAGSYLWLLILMPPFAIQNMVVFFSDITGSAMDINNLQIRLIPLTFFIAAPLATYFLFKSIGSLLRRRVPRLVVISMVLLLALGGASLAVVKGVSEPVLSNAWIFYLPQEYAGVNWLDNSIAAIDTDYGYRLPRVWAGPDFRLGYVWQEWFWGTGYARIPVADRDYTYVFLSPTVRFSTLRLHQGLPDVLARPLIYDNGTVRIYYLPAGAR